jgi:hypothetical protein
MDRQAVIAAKVAHAREVERYLQWLGWSVAVLGVLGVVTFTAMWVTGQLSLVEGVSFILGTALAAILSGATAYGSGVNVGLGAERLELAARADAAPRPGAGPAGEPARGLPR